ncbi:MAG: hypothetical protein DI551_00715 [Micavibrio aeruginosavorus]|uniref:N-acetyltransferase domain-containing protein n=1 Tax=Micavibrio aeruginosavorus TaxID=349221 RepID=A0A2W5NDR8_9BACT|nr:MAG: hypothetical protein DI551_00715 [Micavibrio aeruginosavorus]
MSEAVLRAFLNFKPRAVDAWMCEEPWRDQVIAQILTSPSFVLPSLQTPVAICGVYISCGVGTAWLITGEGFERQAHIVAKQAKQFCRDAYAIYGLHRLHMLVDSDRPEAKRFAEKLGFVCEAARMKFMGARGQDLDIYFLERKDDGRDC